MNVRNISWGVNEPVRRADNIATFMCRLSWNLGASISWEPHGLSRPIHELFCLCLCLCLYGLIHVMSERLIKEAAQVWTHKPNVSWDRNRRPTESSVEATNFRRDRRYIDTSFLPHFRIIGVEENTFPGYLRSTHTPISKTGSNNHASGKRNW